ncbi:PQQ-binding-like beta-propeller repeat protein [Streptomyces sp. NPDC046821]|uniref:outer membrane protein assembly factor BamB family protein n=1 Tax=Streptomyces sp. NPDC046821 TaxID=3154702 RepID=UPI0033F6156A
MTAFTTPAEATELPRIFRKNEMGADDMGVRDTGAVSRRRALRLAGTGLSLALLGAGAWGCSPEDQGDQSKPDAAAPGNGKGNGDADADAFKTPPPGQAPKPLWEAAAANDGLGGTASLAVIGDLALVAGDPLVARDLVTGKEKWSRKGVTTPGAQLILGGGTLYLASAEYDGDVVGLDPATGKETWRSRLGKKFSQPRPIAADDRHLYVFAGILEKDFTTPNNVVAAIDTTSGKVVWQEQRDAGTEETGITAQVAGDRLLYTDYRKNVTVRDTATGHQVWTKKIKNANFDQFAVYKGLVIVADSRKLRALALADGAERWTLDTGDFTSFNGPQVLDGVLYVSDQLHGMWAVTPETGKTVWHNKDLLEKAASAWQFTKVGNTLYGATQLDDKGGVHAFDAATGKLRWTYNDKSGANQQWYLAGTGKRLAAMHAKHVYALPAV